MITLLAYGGGVDSTALLQLILDGHLERPDAVVNANPGAEWPQTYATIRLASERCADAGLHFEIVRHEKDTILTWLERNGNVPVMPGGPHVCSMKFKGEPMQRWAERTYPGQPITWLIGIEAEEGRRVKRFTPPKGSVHSFRYPLVERGLTRADCLTIIENRWGEPVRKSSCFFCPFMEKSEIAEVMASPLRDDVRAIEQRFQRTSPEKHQRWLDAGQPLHGHRAPPGMWRKDAWAEGARLFEKPHNGRRLSVAEWEQVFHDADADPA